MAGRTLYQMFLESVAQYGERPCVGFRADRKADITYWTYNQFNAKIRQFRAGLDALGLKPGDRIALIAHENRVEWAMADLAAHSLGIITVPIYGTLPAPQVAFYLRDSGARVILVADSKQRKKVESIREETPCLEAIIAMDGEAGTGDADGYLTVADILAVGEKLAGEQPRFDAIASAVDPFSVATLIYTSGTTGDPKGAMLTHDNLLALPDGVVKGDVAALSSNDVWLTFLPVSHITERVTGYYLPLRVGGCIVYSLGLMALADELQTTVRPTVICCVPRLWENMQEKSLDALAKRPERERKLIEWGIGVGEQCARRISAGKSPGLLLSLQRAVAEKLVLSKLREKVTGGNLRYCVSGGAPLSDSTAAFFLGIGVPILEGYGLTETNVLAVNRLGEQRIGTVGKILPDEEIEIADDGEIMVRGRGRMQGYYNRPEATAEAINADGWFASGDVGELSADGYLKITDRKKDLLVLTNGKKVAPQPIEAHLKHSPYIGEAVLFGDKSATVTALLVPAFDKLLSWAKDKGLPVKDVEALVALPEVQALYKAEVERETSDLADFEKIKRFKLLTQPFGIDSGELTPTLKVKRKFVAQKYESALDSMRRG